jgi:hypothetical protein
MLVARASCLPAHPLRVADRVGQVGEYVIRIAGNVHGHLGRGNLRNGGPYGVEPLTEAGSALPATGETVVR